MIALNDPKEIDKIIRQELILQSEVNDKNVLNALSTHGVNLGSISSNVFQSYSTSDTIIIFDTKSISDTQDISYTDTNDVIHQYKTYEIYVIIYGNSSKLVASKTIARLRTEKSRYTLRSQGLHLMEVTDFISIDEYINDTMWKRTDFTIKCSCEMNITQRALDEKFEEINEINIKEIN